MRMFRFLRLIDRWCHRGTHPNPHIFTIADLAFCSFRPKEGGEIFSLLLLAVSVYPLEEKSPRSITMQNHIDRNSDRTLTLFVLHSDRKQYE